MNVFGKQEWQYLKFSNQKDQKDTIAYIAYYVQVKCENGQLIITPDVNKAQEQEAKTAFMDEEIKKLKIRYQNEKEEITAKYVAKQSTGCYGKKA